MDALEGIRQAVVACERCPRLRTYCASVARLKRRAYQDWEYWGRPIPGFGDPAARLLVVGLAPAAHGGNRTGRIFTGDSSGDWLYEALHRIGFANQPNSEHRDDGLRLSGAYVAAAARCAPPDNRPSREELMACQPYLEAELRALGRVEVVLALGRIAFDAYRSAALAVFGADAYPRVAFAHGAEVAPNRPGVPVLVASYHPSRQNTQTGRLTRAMWHAVFEACRELASAPR